MSRIEDVDKNFKVQSQLSEKNLEYYDVRQYPFIIYGAAQIDNDGIFRIPKTIACEVSEGVDVLCSNTSGVRVRFKTDSDYIAIYAEY